MPSVDRSQPLLSGQASFQADNWANASASGKLDLLASAQLRRGLNVGLGAGALVELSGSLRKFIAADVQGTANAAARVQAQVQVPLDLFGEFGLAVRLQAIAEAAVGIRLGIGLSVGDFLALAGADPRLQGAPLKLLELLFEPGQVVITAGLKAKAAASAMAYANFLLTGTLVGNRPGFTVAAEAGLGLKAGAGFQVFGSFGLSSPHRFVTRSIDIAVDETLRLAQAHVRGAEGRSLLLELKAPAKMAFRAAFELGWALAENGGAWNNAAGPQLAQRLCIVVLEEGQRYLLETLAAFGLERFRSRLAQVAGASSAWNTTQSLRTRLADRLRAMPDDAFESTQRNREYWLGVPNGDPGVLGDVLRLASDLALGGGDEDAAILWSALQLLFRSFERVSSFSVRGSVIGVGAHTRTTPFTQSLSATPPGPIQAHINGALGVAANAALDEPALVAFLLRDAVLTPLTAAAPHVKQVCEVVFGPSAGAGLNAIRAVLREGGAFVSGPGGAPDAEATLSALLSGLGAFLETRLDQELVPLLRDALRQAPDLQLYLDEVLIPVTRLAITDLMRRPLAWSSSGQPDQNALREACSGVLLKLIGRSLVVTLDVMLHSSLGQVRRELTAAAGHVNDARGIAQVLASATGVDRGAIAELLEETLLVSAETFGPMPEDRRRRIRGLLYQVVDLLPTQQGGEVVSQLRDDFFVPNAEAAVELAMEAGDYIADNLGRFVVALLDRLAAMVLEELRGVIEALEAQVRQWIGQLEALAQELFAAIQQLGQRVQQAIEAAERAWDSAFDTLESLCEGIAGSGRSGVRSKVKRAVLRRAMGELEDHDIYAWLPREARDFAKEKLEDVLGNVLNNRLFDDLWSAIAEIAGGTADLMDDIRDLDLDGNLTAQIGDLVLDRVEDALRGWLGGDDARIDLSIHISLDLGVGRIEETIDLGSVRVPVGRLVDAVRDGVAGLGLFEDHVERLAEKVGAALEAAATLAGLQEEKRAAEEERAHVGRELDESRRGDFAVEVLSPTPAGMYESPSVEVELFLAGVPMSYLGLGEREQQRVTIFLNEEELALDQFVVEERLGPEAPEAPSLVLAGRGGQSGRDIAGSWSPAPGPGRAPVLRYQPGAKVGAWGGTLLLEGAPPGDAKARLKRFQRAEGRSVAPPLDRAQAAVFEARGAKSGRATGGGRVGTTCGGPPGKPGAGEHARDALAGRVRGSPGVSGMSLGRKWTVNERLGRTEALGAGLLLRMDVPASRFLEGLNTLAIAVVPGRGARLERSLSFAVFPARTPSGLRLPQRIPDAGGTVPAPAGVMAFAVKKQRRVEGKPLPGPGLGLSRAKDRQKSREAAQVALQRRAETTSEAVRKRLEVVRTAHRQACEERNDAAQA